MGKRIHLYVSKKSVVLWLMTLCMLASVTARIAVFSQVEGVGIWRQIVWPSVATILFALFAMLRGEEMLYKTAIPIWMLGICHLWQVNYLLNDSPLLYALICICTLFLCMSYTSIINGRHKPWLLLPLFLAWLGVFGYIHRLLFLQELPIRSVYYVLPDYLFILGLITLLFAIKVHTDGKYHPAWATAQTDAGSAPHRPSIRLGRISWSTVPAQTICFPNL